MAIAPPLGSSFLDEEEEDPLRREEEEVRRYRTSQTGMGTAMLNELVKSYGLRRRDDGQWDWSLDNIAQAFKEDPVWTTLDYATMMFAPARFGLAAAGIARGAKASGAIGKGYQVLRQGIGTAEDAATAAAALGGKSAKTGWGKTFQSFGMSPELAAATEMKLAGPSQFHAFRIPGSQRHIGVASTTTTQLSDDYIKLVDRFGGEVWENKAIVKVAERERLLSAAKSTREAEEIARMIGGANLDQAGNERFMKLLSSEVRPEDLDFVVKNAFSDNAAAERAFRNTWGYRNTIHEESYRMGLISKETYEKNLYKYNPTIYEEYIKIQEAKRGLGMRGKSVPGKFPRAADEAISTDVPGEISTEAAERVGRSEMIEGGKGRFQKKGDVEPEHLTGILDPATSLTALAQAGQEIAKQKYAQGIARSVLAVDPKTMATKVMDVVTRGDPREMLLHGITHDKKAMIESLIQNVEKTGRQMAGEEILDALGWRNIDDLYSSMKLPGYLKNMPDELKGKWIDPLVADEVFGALKMMNDEPKLSAILYKNIVSTFRASKTAYNPGTHVRNILGGGIFASMASGSFSSFIPLKGLKTFLNGSADDLKAAAEAGVIGTGYNLEIHSQIAKEANLAARTALDWLPDNLVTKYVKAGAEKAERFYRATDEVYKLDAWLKATNKYQKKGHTLEEARNLATIDVNKFMPNFLQHSQVADSLRQYVPFASFVTESLRVWKNVLAEKPHMAFFYNHFASSLSDIFGAMAGYAPDQIEEAKNALPSYLQGKKTLLLPFNVDGKPSFMDLSYLIPMGSISEMENTERLFFNPIIDPTTNPVMNMGAAMATGKDPFSGREIAPNFTERQLGVPIEGQQARFVVGLGEHMLQMLLPPLAPPGYAGTNILEAVRGQVNPNTGEKLEDGVLRTVLANVVGLRTYAPTVEAQIRNVKEEQRKTSERTKQSWDRWEFAHSNGDIAAMEQERQRIIAIKTREGHDDPEGYFLNSEKKRSNTFSELSTKQLEEIMKRAEKLGKLSPRDERVRAELLARYQSRKD